MPKSKGPHVGMLNREQFVKERYARFLANKKAIESYPPELRQHVMLTDLDKDYGDGPMKNVVLCDRCNEDITDAHFVGKFATEDNQLAFVYHRSCLGDDEIDSIKYPDNVVDLSKVKM